MSNPLHPCAILLQPRLYERGTARPASEARRYLTCTNLVCSGWDRHASPRASSIPVFQLMCGNKPCDMWSCGGSAAAGEAGSLSAGGPERYRPFFHRMCSCDAAYQNFRDNQMHDGHAFRLWPMQIQVWNESSKPCAQLKFWTPVRFRMASLSTIARIKNTWNTRVSARHPLCRLQGSCLGRVGPA